MQRHLLGFVLIFSFAALFVIITSAGAIQASPHPAIAAPVLKWQRAGCYSSWCETGWYSSPAVADLDGSSTPKIIAATYSTFIINGADGTLIKRIDPPVSGARAWSSIVVADLDRDGDLEIVAAHGSGYVRVLDHTGNVVWTRQPATNELRSLAVYDLDQDGDLEILVASTQSQNQWHVYEHDGTERAGWPQLPDSAPGYAAGAYNENIGVADLDGDGRGEIVGPSDVHYITAYEDNGAQIPANPRYGSNKVWSQVGVHVSDAVDLRGWAYCGAEHRPNFAHSPPILVDVNRDGVLEIIVAGNVYNCATPYTDLYYMPFIFKRDRSRWSGSGFDWTAIPVPDGQAAPLSEDYNLIENAQPNPVAADLDGDGYMEILYASYDGRVHAYWLDKTEHGSWPHAVYNPAEGFFRFASEPTVADLDNDGFAEVIFSSWVQKGTYQTGKLHILDYLGNTLQTVNLPNGFGSSNWNGALAAPTLANIDSDGDLEIVLNTANSGVVAYDLPGTANARVLWGTGRGNYQRTGSFLAGSLASSSKSVQPALPRAGSLLTYTITLRNPGPLLPSVRVTDTLPAQVNNVGNLWASSGNYGYASGVITWTGAVLTSAPVTITFNATVSDQITTPRVITNTALINDGWGNVLQRQAIVIANGIGMYLPLVKR
jgi:uncharacterized repeat protein (TIGR01451 family)